MGNQKTYITLIAILYLICFITICTNLDSPYLWYDEAGQFFISKGLNHDSNPLEKGGDFSSVLTNNALYNMDPGGFSILLHFWAKISNYHIWLRLLPFIFFIGSIFCIIFLIYHWLKIINIAILLGFIPFLIPLFLNMGL